MLKMNALYESTFSAGVPASAEGVTEALAAVVAAAGAAEADGAVVATAQTASTVDTAAAAEVAVRAPGRAAERAVDKPAERGPEGVAFCTDRGTGTPDGGGGFGLGAAHQTSPGYFRVAIACREPCGGPATIRTHPRRILGA
ncbi:hypothetical protein GCM10010393_38790 [Streptomyces gobitricini]|uniref:Uncharacterized protein n=1 Tax=Streptomyces gobitricini TaxID=68211 RepID=A0ABN3MIL4_9ACTN